MWIAIHAFGLTFMTLSKAVLAVIGGLVGAAAFLVICIGLAVSLALGNAPSGLK